MSRTFKISEDASIVFDEDRFTVKKNGLTISFDEEEMLALGDAFEKMENIVKAETLDAVNGLRNKLFGNGKEV